jgi:hypothetical protein
MAFAIEWHFSRLIGLWNWSEARGGWTINGVPAVNFLIWSVVGLISPVLQRIGRAPRIKYRSPSVFLQCLPVLGFGLALAFNGGLNIVRSFPGAGALCASSVFVLGLALAVRFRRRAGSARRPYPNQEE